MGARVRSGRESISPTGKPHRTSLLRAMRLVIDAPAPADRVEVADTREGSVCWVSCTVRQCREKIRQGCAFKNNCDVISASPTGILLGTAECEPAEPQL